MSELLLSVSALPLHCAISLTSLPGDSLHIKLLSLVFCCSVVFSTSSFFFFYLMTITCHLSFMDFDNPSEFKSYFFIWDFHKVWPTFFPRFTTQTHTILHKALQSLCNLILWFLTAKAPRVGMAFNDPNQPHLGPLPSPWPWAQESHLGLDLALPWPYLQGGA